MMEIDIIKIYGCIFTYFHLHWLIRSQTSDNITERSPPQW